MIARRQLLLVSPLALLVTVPLAAQQSPGSFQLPPNPASTGVPAQGPVDDSAPLIRAPRVVNTPTPTPTTQPTPRPSPAASPQPTPAPVPSAAPTVRPSPQPSAPSPAPSATDPAVLPEPIETAPLETAFPIPTPTPQATMAETAATSAMPFPFPWPWLGALGAALLALAGGWIWWKRSKDNAEPPQIERPAIVQAPQAPDDKKAAAAPVTLQAEALKLSRSMMNATLHYRLSVTNRGSSALGQLMIGGDLVSAHSGKPMEQQVAGIEDALAVRHHIDRISPGQTRTFEGTLQLPLSLVHPIRQASAVLFVPLMRWQLAGQAIAPLARTFVVGTLPQVTGGRLQPFRLDEQPQDYSAIGQRAID